MIQDKLVEADENEIFMSDEEDVSEDECPICMELLRDELHTLVSCIPRSIMSNLAFLAAARFLHKFH